MKILVLGGTVFAGRALVEAAVARGHQLTLFNRGRSNPDLFPGVEKLVGDRKAGDLSVLKGRSWNAVIDPSGYIPRAVRQSAELLSTEVGHYTFISSLSVYADSSRPGIDENAPVGVLEDESVEEVTGETYGPLKALSEQAAEKAMPGRVLVIRPGLIVGPYDPTDRFTYWPHRVAQGGQVLAPGNPSRQIQFIDVRDLAEWTIEKIEEQKTGTYNADGPVPPLTMGQLLETCKAVSGSDAQITWVSDDFLTAQGVGAWIELPLWIPESEPEAAGFFAFNVEKAIAAGLTFRPLEETVRATLEWDAARSADNAWRAGLTKERETELLTHWEK